MGPKRRATVGQNQKVEPRYDIVTCDRNEFLEFASMCKDPTSLANRLLSLLDAGTSRDDTRNEGEQEVKVTLKCYVELIIRSYWCYQVVSSLDGIDNLLERMKTELIDTLVEKKEFALIVRILLCTRNFTDLGYLFDILMKHEQFELVLRRNPDKSIQNELKLVLATYLKQKFPEDDEKLMMVYLRFNMFREYGTMLMNKAMAVVESVHEKIIQGSLSSKVDEEESLENHLLTVIGQLSSASESFISDDCLGTALKCIAQRNLVEVQIDILRQFKKKAFSVFCMSISQARLFLKTHPVFEQSLAVSKAYEIHTMSEWIEPIYYQCIVQSNMQYFVSLREHLQVSSNLFREIARRFKNENSLQPKMVSSMTNFCTLCPDYSVRLEIMKQLGQLNSEIAYEAAAILDVPLQEDSEISLPSPEDKFE